jgi:hypothetical protein
MLYTTEPTPLQNIIKSCSRCIQDCYRTQNRHDTKLELDCYKTQTYFYSPKSDCSLFLPLLLCSSALSLYSLLHSLMISNSTHFFNSHATHVASLEHHNPYELSNSSIICPMISHVVFFYYSRIFPKIFFWFNMHVVSLCSSACNTKLGWCTCLPPFIAQLLICACKTDVCTQQWYVCVHN